MSAAMPRAMLGPVEVSRIVYGMWRLADDSDTSVPRVRAKLDACLEAGITTIDQADIYGGYTAEGLLGAALREAPGLRERFEIVTKCGILIDAGRHAGRVRVKHYDTTAEHVRASVDASRREMGVDVIDLLLVHRPDPLMDHRETGAALDALVAEGVVGAVGASNFRPWDVELLQSAMDAPLVTNQIEIGLGRVAPFADGDLAFHQRRGEPVMAWSPLGGGALMEGPGPVPDLLGRMAAERDVAPGAVALAFLLRHPAGIVPVIGTNRPERIGALAAATGVELSRQDWFALYEAALGREVA